MPGAAPPVDFMKRGFYTIIAAQFLSSLADNALLIAAIALLRSLDQPHWMTPALKQFFVVSYVVFAPLVGAFADSMAKGRVMLITNAVKFAGCALMLLYVHPLLSYALVGLGAAAYSPAKYGILTELLPPDKLVIANAWMEGTTVGSIILGVLLGGTLITPRVSAQLLGIDVPLIELPIDTAAQAAIAVIMVLYLAAAIVNWFIPDTGVDHRVPSTNPLYLVREFSHCVALLWRDHLGQITLATTTLFWGAAATMQFIVIDWSARALSLSLSQSTFLQGAVLVGAAIGTVLAAWLVSLRRSTMVLPVGVAVGVILMAMVLVTRIPMALLLLVAIGACTGFFVVPMNALLQHRGHVLMGAGHSIAVQNFNENLGILVTVGMYALMLRAGLSINVAIVLFGTFIAAAMLLVIWRHRYNESTYGSMRLVGVEKPRGASPG